MSDTTPTTPGALAPGVVESTALLRSHIRFFHAEYVETTLTLATMQRFHQDMHATDDPWAAARMLTHTHPAGYTSRPLPEWRWSE